MPPPVILRLPFGGVCDANGNLTLKNITPSRSFYTVFTAALRITGGGQPIIVMDLSGLPMMSGTGTQVTLGPCYTSPEEALSLVVTGAASKAVVTGQLYGFFASSPEELPVAPPGLGGSVTIQAPVTPPWAAVGSQGPQLAHGVTLIPVPTGALTFLLTVTSGGVAGGEVVITGAQSGTLYADLYPTGLGTVASTSVNLQGDTALIATVTTGIPGTASVSWLLQFLSTLTPQSTNVRTSFAATFNAIASVNVVTLISLTPVRNGVAGGAATSLSVTALKVLRLTGLTVDFTTAAGTVVANCIFALRVNPVGAVLATSAIVALIRLGANTAAANAIGWGTVPFIEGSLELTGAAQFGLTQQSGVTTGVIDGTLSGYEY